MDRTWQIYTHCVGSVSGPDRFWGTPVGIRGSYRRLKERAWKVTIHLQLMLKNGWIHTFSPPHALTVQKPNFNFTLSYVHICCLLSKNRNIKIYRLSCACICVQLGLSHYRQNLGWGGSTTGYWGRYPGLRDRKEQEIGEKCTNEEPQDLYRSANITQVIK
jgi:hypothetical protein